MAVRKSKENSPVANESHVVRPRITEKATMAAEMNNTFVFDVARTATKRDIAVFMEAVYKVTPVKVRMARVPAKNVTYRGRQGVKPAGKKAYVYLKKGDKIEIV